MKMVNQDEEHLRMLSICFYIWGGLVALCSFIGVLEGLIGVVVMTIAAQQPNGPPAAVGVVFIVLGALIVLLLGTIGALTIWTGRNIQKRTRYTLCIVVAAISCLSVPLGTALGVFTIIVLMRPSVKQLFDQTPPAPVT